MAGEIQPGAIKYAWPKESAPKFSEEQIRQAAEAVRTTDVVKHAGQPEPRVSDLEWDLRKQRVRQNYGHMGKWVASKGAPPLSHMMRLGRGWLPHPPEGFTYPDDLHLAMFGVLGYSNWADHFEHALVSSHTVGTLHQQTFNLNGSAVLQEFLRANGPTFFVDADLVKTCSDLESLRHVRTDDLKRRWPFSLFVLAPNHYVFVGFLEDQEMVVRFGSKQAATLKNPGRTLILSTWDPGDELEGCTTVYVRNLPPGESLAERIEAVAADPSLECLETTVLVQICNLLLIQQSYPEYAEPVGTRVMMQKPRAGNEPAPVYRFRSRARPLRPRVVPHQGHPHELTGREVRPHFRPGHWRRQPHGERWALANPQVEPLFFPDGRAYHMKWIEMVAVNFDKKESSHEPA